MADDCPMRGVRWVKLRSLQDERGSLTVIEGERDIPFAVRRAYYMHRVGSDVVRGGHAHRDTDQFAVAVHGSLRLRLTDGETSITVILNDPTWGVTMPRMTWARLFDFSHDCVCLVLANTHYDMSKSVRDWSEYLTARHLSARSEPVEAPQLVRPIP